VKVDVIRVEDGKDGTFGVLLIEDRAFCVTLEPEWNDNKKGKSCIPEGDYVCRKTKSPHFGLTFKICGVYGRSNVLFHAGNIVKNTKGCVILGQYFGKLRGDRAVLNSGNTFKEFMEVMEDSDVFKLTIKRV
jgi:hypothetical protein